MVHAICDQVVDGYEQVTDSLVEDVDEVEMSVFSEDRTDDSARIYVLKRELAEVRRAVLPLRDNVPTRSFPIVTVALIAAPCTGPVLGVRTIPTQVSPGSPGLAGSGAAGVAARTSPRAAAHSVHGVGRLPAPFITVAGSARAFDLKRDR